MVFCFSVWVGGVCFLGGTYWMCVRLWYFGWNMGFVGFLVKYV